MRLKEKGEGCVICCLPSNFSLFGMAMFFCEALEGLTDDVLRRFRMLKHGLYFMEVHNTVHKFGYYLSNLDLQKTAIF